MSNILNTLGLKNQKTPAVSISRSNSGLLP